MSKENVTVASITSTHGLKGDVRIYPVLSPPELLKKLKHVYLMKNGEQVLLNIESLRPYKKPLWLLKTKEWHVIEDAELYKGCDLVIAKEDLPKLPANSFYIGDLIGSQIVLANGEVIGTLKDVLERGGSDLYVIKTDGNDLLLPAVKEFILNVNLENKVITVFIPEGLRDL